MCPSLSHDFVLEINPVLLDSRILHDTFENHNLSQVYHSPYQSGNSDLPIFGNGFMTLASVR